MENKLASALNVEQAAAGIEPVATDEETTATLLDQLQDPNKIPSVEPEVEPEVPETPFIVPASTVRSVDNSKFLSGTELVSDDRRAVIEEESGVNKERPSLVEGWKAARELESTMAALANINHEATYDEDPNFSFTQDLFEDVTKDIPEIYHDDFVSARSEKHARFMAARMKEELNSMNELSKFGMLGAFGLRMGAATIEEGNIALTLASGGVGGALNLGLKANRLRKIMRAGIVSGAENVALEALLLEGSQTKDSADLLYAGLGGFALGAGAAGARSVFSKAERQALSSTARDAMSELDEVILKEEAGIDIKGRVNRRESILGKTNDELDAPEAMFGGVRFGVSAQGKSSKSKFMRELTSKLVKEQVSHKDNSVIGETAEDIIKRLETTEQIKMYATAKDALARYTRARGYTVNQKSKDAHREDFFNDVSKSIREGATGDVDVDATANVWRKMFKTVLDEARNSGVKGFDDIADNANYFPRILHKAKIRNISKNFNSDEVSDLIAKAARASRKDLTELEAKAIGKSYWHTASRLSDHNEINFDRPLSADNTDFIASALRDVGDVNEADIASIVRKLSSKSDAGIHDRAKHRTNLDESVSAVLTKRDGTTQRLHITDLFDNNAERVGLRYLRSVGGLSAIARTTGLRSIADVNAATRRVEAEARAAGLSNRQVTRDVDNAEFMFASLLGRSTEDDPMGLFSQSSRVVRDANFVQLSGMFGSAQLAELGNLISAGTLRRLIMAVPEMKSIFSRAANGKLNNELAAELEGLTGIGADRLRNQPSARFEEVDSGAYIESTRLSKISAVAKRTAADVSGMAPVNTFLQRMASVTIARRWSDMALGKGDMSDKRLAVLGLDRVMFDRVKKQLREHSVKRKGKLRELNVESWKDRSAANAFILAMSRAGRKAIQENDIGTMHRYMGSTMGLIVTQFRRFMLGAWENVTLHNIAMRDWEAFTLFMTSTLIGGLVYTGRIHLLSQGREDKKKFLKERLSPTEIAKAAFQMSSSASLIPAAIDSLWSMSGEDPLFRYGRSSTLASNLLTGNPSVDALNKLFELRSLPAKAVRGDMQVSERDAKNIKRLLPFQTLFGVSNVLNVIAEDFPNSNES